MQITYWKRLLFIGVLGLPCLLLAEPSGSTQLIRPAAETPPLATEIIASVMSPYCPGRLLRDCPSTAAEELRQDIITMAQSGRDFADIQEALVARYGEDVLASPRFVGFGMLAWLGPIVFLILGVVVMLIWLRSRKKTAS